MNPRDFKTILIGFLGIVSSFTYGQNSKARQATQREERLMKQSRDCSKVRSISPGERRKLYPFNKAALIQLVSFKSNIDQKTGEPYKDSLPLLHDTVCFSKLFEVKTLTNFQSDSLSDLIFNYGFISRYKPKGNVYFISTVLQCYNPRNAILFLDKDRKVFEFIEICFECERTKSSSDRVSIGTECNQKLQLLKSLFKQVGIRFGLSEGG
jgi:hypothetical protein